MGDKEEYWGKPVLLSDGKEISYGEKQILPVIDLPSKWVDDAPHELNLTFTISNGEGLKLMRKLATMQARQYGKDLADWIKFRMIGDRLPRKKKKWCKKELAKFLDNGYGLKMHYLKYIKPKRMR